MGNLSKKSKKNFPESTGFLTRKFVGLSPQPSLINQIDQLSAPCDHYLRKSLRDSFSIKICDNFHNLEHLAIVDIRICPHGLHHLLKHFQKTLKSLFLNPEKKSDCYRTCDHPPIDFPLSILSAINSLTSLRQLALSEDYLPDIEGSLSEVLSHLEELHLVEYLFDYVEILSQVDETKFRRLTLENGGWIDGELSTLVREKPGLGRLTHLNVDVQSGVSLIPKFNFEALDKIVTIFPLLEHLGINTDYNPIRKLIPVVSQLKSLSSLKMATNLWPLEYDIEEEVFSCALTGDQQVEYRLESLQVLRLETYLRIDDLAVIRGLYPNLRQLYLDAVQFQCLCFEAEENSEDEDHFEDEENIEAKEYFFTLPSLRPPGCTCKARIAKHLDSFEYLPKINLG